MGASRFFCVFPQPWSRVTFLQWGNAAVPLSGSSRMMDRAFSASAAVSNDLSLSDTCTLSMVAVCTVQCHCLAQAYNHEHGSLPITQKWDAPKAMVIS